MHHKKKISENQRRFIEAVNPEPSKKMAATRERRASRALRKASAYIAIEVLMALDERGWSQSQLADVLGVSAQQVSKWVRGTENFTLETIVKLEGILDIKLLANEENGSEFQRAKSIRGVEERVEIQRANLTEGVFCYLFFPSRSTKEIRIQLGNKVHYTVCQPNKRVQVLHLG